MEGSEGFLQFNCPTDALMIHRQLPIRGGEYIQIGNTPVSNTHKEICMKRGFIVLAVALLASNLFAETLFEAIDASALSGDIKKIKAQVEVIEADVNAPSKDFETKGYTPLTYAITKLDSQLRLDAVTYLLSQKANANGKATLLPSIMKVEGIVPELTPLTAALFTRDFALVKTILDAGADPTLALRHSNRDFKDPRIEYFGQKYVQNAKAKVTALDIAVYLKAPVLIGLLKEKAPKLTASYNTDTLWYAAFTNDLAGFKKMVKAGKVPTAYDVAYLVHYGKKDFLAFVDAAAIFQTKQKEEYVENTFAFSLVDDATLISVVSDYLDKNAELAKSDLAGFIKGVQALPVDWKKVRLWGMTDLFKDPNVDDYWNFDRIVTAFSHRPELTKAFLIANHSAELDGYYGTTDGQLWLSISESGTKFDARFKDKSKGTNASGTVTFQDAANGFLLCDFGALGKYWVKPPMDSRSAIEMQSDLKKTYKTTSYAFNRWSKVEWDTQSPAPEGGK